MKVKLYASAENDHIFKMDNYSVIIFVAVSILFVDEVSSLLRCRICRGAKYLDECHSSETCSHDEYCFMDLKVTVGGNVEYWGGCRSRYVCTTSESKKSDVVACSQCCPRDDCNTGLCHLPAIHTNGTVRCWSCPDGVDDTRHCDNVATCVDDELCYSGMTTTEYGVKHITKCYRKEICTHLTMAVMEVQKLKEQFNQLHPGKRQTPVCDICCGAELCNSMPCTFVRDRLYLYYKTGRLNNETLTMQVHHHP